MRVTLLYAPYPGQSFRDEDTTISPVRVRNPKSALVTLAAGARAYLREWGVDAEFKIVDTQVDDGEPEHYASFQYGPRTIDCHRYGGPFEAYADEARAADIIGISNNFTNSARVVTEFATFLKQVNPNALIVGGGMDVTARPDWYLANGFDVVIQLEGELTFAKLIQARATGQPIEGMVMTRRVGDGLVIMGGAQLNLAELPPMALDLIDDLSVYDDTGEGQPPMTVRAPFTCFETSRGCYRTCSFCATPMRGHYRYMKPEVVRRHFEYLKSMGISNILFQEDNTLSRIQRSGRGTLLHDSGREDTLEIFRMAREMGFSWEFANGLEFGKFLDLGEVDRELMETLFWNDTSGDRWIGCYRVQIPLEYLGDEPTKKFNKLRPFQEQLQIVTSMLDLGVRYLTFNMLIGHDDDDQAMIDMYLDRCLQLKARLNEASTEATNYFNVFNRTLLPGTADFRKKADRLSFDIEKTPEVISVYLSPMPSNHLSYYQLFEQRLRLTEALNGSLIDQYDGIYRPRTQKESVPVV
ncbi:cobalamin-dependent protein [Micromonospora sp. NPDC053740]|uniref:B12-binding domain-containing radical SAM protein n=1 Tax=Micromonospora TaxID=1873 RepID=UPI001EE79B3D|nr:cobalamin-dependent protein [Micromonospora alfalfae]MCG5463625.1 cobalamin-dependent protein [Micromonospora alfalfae]